MSSPQTRGFLFADLRDYTRFAEEHGDAAAADILRRYRLLVREARHVKPLTPQLSYVI